MINLDGRTLSSAEVQLVANGEKVSVASDSWQGIDESREVVEKIIQANETVYGINTGFGALSETTIPPGDLLTLQLNLIRSHACAIGEKMSINDTRAMMCIRANSLVKGNSGVQRSVINQIIDYLNHGIVPVVPRMGSLGASGDLAPLSHMALTLIGEGNVWGESGPIETNNMLKQKGLIGIELGAKDGLSLINGTSQMCAFLSRVEQVLNRLLPMADLIACVTMDARRCSIRPMDHRVQAVRPHPGQVLIAKRISAIMQNSENINKNSDKKKIQDAYSFRCIPQVHGAVTQIFSELQKTLEIEINSATDNPLIFPSNTEPLANQVISQGNFHGEILALVADNMAHALFELGHISERRIDQLIDPTRSSLPAFLARDSGLESGLMIVHYVAAAALSELHAGSTPRSAFSTPTSGGQEDFVSMGATSCWNLIKSCDLITKVLACELLTACEALEYLDDKPSKHVECLYNLVRKISKPLTADRSTSNELEMIAVELYEGRWLSRIEAECGRLPR